MVDGGGGRARRRRRGRARARSILQRCGTPGGCLQAGSAGRVHVQWQDLRGTRSGAPARLAFRGLRRRGGNGRAAWKSPGSSNRWASPSSGQWRRRWATGCCAGRTSCSPPAGGWPTRPGRMEDVPAGTLTVWLRVTPATAIERSRARPGARPLLDGERPLKRAQTLLAEREPYYGKAELSVGTEEASVSALAQWIVRVVGGLEVPGARDSFKDSGRGW